MLLCMPAGGSMSYLARDRLDARGALRPSARCTATQAQSGEEPDRSKNQASRLSSPDVPLC